MAEIARLERQQVNQAAVLRRKAEEATAANNRLKDLLVKQKVVTENKTRKLEQADTSSIGARIRVSVRLNHAHTHIHTLLHIVPPRAGCRVVRIDPLRFLAGCCTR